jgi:hypothetical protein
MFNLHTSFYRSARNTALGIALTAASMGQAHAALLWDWSYSGTGVAAGGIFLTTDTADMLGF